MQGILIGLILVGQAVVLALVLLLKKRGSGPIWALQNQMQSFEGAQGRLEQAVRSEFSGVRQENLSQARSLREEVQSTIKNWSESMTTAVFAVSKAQSAQLEEFTSKLSQLNEAGQKGGRELREEINAGLKGFGDSVVLSLGEMGNHQKGQLESFSKTQVQMNDLALKSSIELRQEVKGVLKDSADSMMKSLTEISNLQKADLEAFSKQIVALTESNEKKLNSLRDAVEGKLGEIRTDNERKLEEMRKTVDEKLQGTLEKRLGESFKLVSQQLEQVHQGLGEMQTLANGVGDLKKVLTNVKTRGIWGEFAVGTLLEQILSTEQYAANVATKEGSDERVDFAVRLPGKDDQVVWLPIDSKFPKEDYERLVDASERCDLAGVDEASRQLEARVRSCAREVSAKYLNPPQTTDFAIMYLPTEGLYAEVVRRPGLMEMLQREYRINVAGPTTLAALLNSLQMGFRTLAIQERSSEVWKVLGGVKTEFGRFGEILGSVKKKLHQAADTIDKAEVRTRAISRKLRSVEELPAAEAQVLLTSEIDAEANADGEKQFVGESIA